MLRDSNGHLLTESTEKLFTLRERLDFQFSHSPSCYYLVVRAQCNVVLLFTDDETEVEALRVRKETVQLNLFDRSPSGEQGRLCQSYANFALGLRQLRVKRGDIDPSFNCHGYCFGDSQYWINNDQVKRILLGDGYQEFSSKEAVSIVVYSLEEAVTHSAKRCSSDNGFSYVSKAGVRGLRPSPSIEDAARGLPYDGIKVFHRPRLCSESG